MADRSIPNLPSRDLAATSEFYGRLGFREHYRDDGWMILRRGDLQLEFFPHPGLSASDNWFSCGLRVKDLESLHEAFRDAGVPTKRRGRPNLQGITEQPWGRIATLLDPDGNLLRLIEDTDD
jgi:catechol 2,3-dioxygenase-like lactoylglutathione lyase family enzyme